MMTVVGIYFARWITLAHPFIHRHRDISLSLFIHPLIRSFMDSVLAFPVGPPPPTFTNTNTCYKCDNCFVYDTHVPNTPHVVDCMNAAVALGSSSFAIGGVANCYVAGPGDFPITQSQVQCAGGQPDSVFQIFNVNYPAAPPASYVDLGCWIDANSRALSNVANNFAFGYNVETCGALAQKNNATVFAVQDGWAGTPDSNGPNGNGGQCFWASGSDDYTKYGASQKPCQRLGDEYVSHVYSTK